MSHTITLQPSGRQFTAERGETLLEAALRSGVNLNYHCSNGSCGECKARLVSGTLGEERFHDYVLNDADKYIGNVLLCSVTPASDMVIEAQEANVSGDIPVQLVGARVSKLERIGERNMVLYLRTPRTRTLRFLAGQYVRLYLRGLPVRELAIASCPCNGMVLQFHLRYEPGDPFLEHLFQRMQIGETVEVEGPFGDFTLDDDSHRPIVMAAMGSGFAPLKSLIEHFIALELPQPLHLYWLTRFENGHYLANFCRSLVDALDGFVYHPVLLDTRQDEATALAQLGQRMLTEVAPASELDLYLSGPEAMHETLIDAFTRAGTPCDRIAVYPHGRGRHLPLSQALER